MKITRTCIFPKDVQLITGRSEPYGRKLLHAVKGYFDKHPHQFVTPEEFAEYIGIKLEVVHDYLKKVS